MIIDLITGIIPITLITITFIIALIPFLRHKKRLVSADENEMIRYITQGVMLILKRFIIFGAYAAIGFTALMLILNTMNQLPAYRTLLIFISFLMSTAIGWTGLKLSINSLRQLLHFSSNSLGKLYEAYQFQSQFILITTISIAILDLSIWFLILDTLTTLNIANLGQICANFFGFEWTASLTSNPDFINHKHFFIALGLAGYIIGATLQSLLARFNSSIFAVPLDTAGDIVGFSEYDLPEDELRNPTSIPDQIGDQIKGTFLVISELYSISVILIVALAIIGGKAAIIEHAVNSMTLIEFPLLFISSGLLLTLVIRKLISKLNTDPQNIFQTKLMSQCLVTLFLGGIFSLCYKFNLLPLYIILPSLIGLLSAILLYCMSHSFFGFNSKAISFIRSLSKHNIIGTVSAGLFMGFLSTMIIGSLLGLIITIGFNMSGHNLHIITDLYNVSLIGLGIFVGSLTLFSDPLCLALVDNAIGISHMLSTEHSKISSLKKIKIICSTTSAHFKILAFNLLVLISGIFLFITMTRSLQWVYTLEQAGLNTIHHVTSSKTQLFDLAYEINAFILPFGVHFLDLKFIIGLLLGITFLFGLSAYLMVSVAKSNQKITSLIHNEYKSNPAILDNKVFPDYMSLVTTLAKSASAKMLIFFSLIIVLSIPAYCLIGISGTIGFILSQVIGGFALNTFFVTCGTLWGNAKTTEEISTTELETSQYISLFFADKLGDLFKDSLGPCITNYVKFNILFIIILLGIILKINEGVFF